MKNSDNDIPDTFQQEEAAAEIQPTMRCEVIIGLRRGEVKFIGKVPEIALDKLDEPTGDSNGTIKGKAYFDVNGGSKQ